MAEEQAQNQTSGQGRAVVLSNGERRVDYIRRRHYIDGATRSEIAKEVSEMQEKPCPYQIVFSATKPDEMQIGDKTYPRPESAVAKSTKANSEESGEDESGSKSNSNAKGGSSNKGESAAKG